MTRVATPQGEVLGLRRDGHDAFLGVRFAAPLSPEGRYRPAAPARAHPNEWDATRFRESCPQAAHRLAGFVASGPTAEDCLFLNVYTPAAGAGSRPVMVWIHGGGFGYGSGSELLYDGGALARRCDVVVVSIHYRLGLLGFAALGDTAASWGATANAGLLDMVEALRWVRANIRAYGGDPANVTIFGESAGSAAVGCLLAMPAASGLFHKAIMQSGVGTAGDAAPVTARSVAVLSELGANVAEPASVRGISAQAIVDAAKATETSARSYAPVLEAATLPVSPLEPAARARVPLLIGTNRDESRLFNVFKGRPEMSSADLLAGVGRMCAVSAAMAGEIVSIFSGSRAEAGLGASNEELHDAIASVQTFRLPAARVAGSHQAPVYHYFFEWESPAMRGALGACHALEIPFVFGTLDAPTQDRFAGTGPEVENLAGRMMDAWAAFARTGDPSTGALPWSTYDANNRATMRLGRDCGMDAEPLPAERAVLAG